MLSLELESDSVHFNKLPLNIELISNYVLQFLPKFKWGMDFFRDRALFTKFMIEIQPFYAECSFEYNEHFRTYLNYKDTWRWFIFVQNQTSKSTLQWMQTWWIAIIWMFTLVHISNVKMYSKRSKRSSCLEQMFEVVSPKHKIIPFID